MPRAVSTFAERVVYVLVVVVGGVLREGEQSLPAGLNDARIPSTRLSTGTGTIAGNEQISSALSPDTRQLATPPQK